MEFVEVETLEGKGFSIGDWIQDGEYMLLVIDDPRAWKAMAVELAEYLSLNATCWCYIGRELLDKCGRCQTLAKFAEMKKDHEAGIVPSPQPEEVT